MRTLRGGDHAKYRTPIVDLDTPAAIVFTSGTTGKPRGVIFTHATTAGEMHEWLLMEPIQQNGLRPVLVLLLFTTAGIIWGISRVVLHGGTLFLQPKFEPSEALRILSEEKANTLTGPPILFEQIAKAPGFVDADLSHMVTAHVGGARVPVGLLHKWQARGVALQRCDKYTGRPKSADRRPQCPATKHPNIPTSAGGAESSPKSEWSTLKETTYRHTKPVRYCFADRA